MKIIEKIKKLALSALVFAAPHLNALEPISFTRGDTTLDKKLNISDPILTLNYLFRGEPIDCQDAADANDDGKVNISDPILTLNYLFRGEEKPAPPFPQPGNDTTPDQLECKGFQGVVSLNEGGKTLSYPKTLYKLTEDVFKPYTISGEGSVFDGQGFTIFLNPRGIIVIAPDITVRNTIFQDTENTGKQKIAIQLKETSSPTLENLIITLTSPQSAGIEALATSQAQMHNIQILTTGDNCFGIRLYEVEKTTLEEITAKDRGRGENIPLALYYCKDVKVNVSNFSIERSTFSKAVEITKSKDITLDYLLITTQAFATPGIFIKDAYDIQGNNLEIKTLKEEAHGIYAEDAQATFRNLLIETMGKGAHTIVSTAEDNLEIHDSQLTPADSESALIAFLYAASGRIKLTNTPLNTKKLIFAQAPEYNPSIEKHEYLNIKILTQSRIPISQALITLENQGKITASTNEQGTIPTQILYIANYQKNKTLYIPSTISVTHPLYLPFQQVLDKIEGPANLEILLQRN